MSGDYPLIESEWTEQRPNLPDRSDFFESDDDLDGRYAWKHFGNLNLAQAYERFCENPHFYQEDFMSMGGKAFAFYFPVIERYLFECTPKDDYDCKAWIIAEGIKIQLKSSTADAIKPLCERLLSLTGHVLSKLEPLEPDERARVQQAWTELKSMLEDH